MKNRMMSMMVVALLAGWAWAESTDKNAGCGNGPVMPEIFGKGETVLFQGDSITHGGRMGDMNHYLGHGYAAEIAMRSLAYAPLLGVEFANRGVSGDTTRKLLARWDRDGIAPKVVSIMIGTNNVRGPGPVENTAEEIFEAIQTICARVKEKVPSATIVLSNILPRGPTADDLYRTKPSQVNALLARWAPTQPQLVYVNVYNEFLGPDGRLGRDMMGDYCHPTDKGYDVWAAALLPHFRRLLGR